MQTNNLRSISWIPAVLLLIAVGVLLLALLNRPSTVFGNRFTSSDGRCTVVYPAGWHVQDDYGDVLIVTNRPATSILGQGVLMGGGVIGGGNIGGGSIGEPTATPTPTPTPTPSPTPFPNAPDFVITISFIREGAYDRFIPQPITLQAVVDYEAQYWTERGAVRERSDVQIGNWPAARFYQAVPVGHSLIFYIEINGKLVSINAVARAEDDIGQLERNVLRIASTINCDPPTPVQTYDDGNIQFAYPLGWNAQIDDGVITLAGSEIDETITIQQISATDLGLASTVNSSIVAATLRGLPPVDSGYSQTFGRWQGITNTAIFHERGMVEGLWVLEIGNGMFFIVRAERSYDPVLGIDSNTFPAAAALVRTLQVRAP